jgi:HD-like signal output (HDOD) protein/ActR/RegA family two-component response regulator
MNRILFVDDDPNILTGLQRLLRPQRHEWDMSFVGGGEAALALLTTAPYDVIVTDARMPGMDGPTLLDHVRQRYPEVRRIVLSGQTEISLTLRAMRLAHQFLPKPCDPEVLRVAIERACTIKRVLASESLIRVIGSIGDLPTAPRVYSALAQALSDPQPSLDEIGRLVEQDMGLSAKVLQLVNSAFFGLSRDITSVRHAVSHLGLNVIQTLVASVEAIEVFDGTGWLGEFSVDEFQKHAQLTARIASSFPLSRDLCDAAAAGGLLHDVGKLVLACRLPEQLREATRVAAERRQPLHKVEAELYGVTHAEIGAYLLGTWGLPASVIEAVAHHHNPLRIPHQGLNPVSVVYLADLLAHEFEFPPSGFPVSAAVLRELGIEEQYPVLRDRARQSIAEAQVESPGPLLECRGRMDDMAGRS